MIDVFYFSDFPIVQATKEVEVYSALLDVGQLFNGGIKPLVAVQSINEIGEVLVRNNRCCVCQPVNVLRVAPPFLPPLGADLPVSLRQQTFDLGGNIKAYPFPIGKFVYDTH